MTRMPLYAPHTIAYAASADSTLSEAFCHGARRELLLSPKPGLVDLHDNGSHDDLDLMVMQRSIELLPLYYDELLEQSIEAPNIAQLRAIGLRAEERMLEHCQTNTHRGYLFLSGLVLLAIRSHHDVRLGIIRLSQRLFQVSDRDGSHGELARRRYRTGGIIDECLQGLPAVFEHGLPCYRQHLAEHGDETRAALAMMATLMQVVDDTTSYHRCGEDGIQQVQRDGVELAQRLAAGDEVESWLLQRNQQYQQMNLTMGGVADLIAICFALDRLLN